VDFKPTSLAGAVKSAPVGPQIGPTSIGYTGSSSPTIVGSSTGPSFKPNALPKTAPKKDPVAPVERKQAAPTSFAPANALKGERVVVDIPTLAELKLADPTSDDKDLNAARELLVRNLPAKGASRDWSDFGIDEQKEAARLASQFMELSKTRAFVDARSMLNRVNELIDRLYEWFESKGIFNFMHSDTKFEDNVNQLEKCVTILRTVSTQLEPATKEMSDLVNKILETENNVRILILANNILSRIRPQDERDMIDMRLVSLTKSWNNLLEMKLMSSTVVQSMKNINALLIDTVLTTIPSWISVTTLNYLNDESNRILAKNKLEEIRATSKGAI